MYKNHSIIISYIVSVLSMFFQTISDENDRLRDEVLHLKTLQTQEERLHHEMR